MADTVQKLDQVWGQMDLQYQQLKPWFKDLSRFFNPGLQRFDDNYNNQNDKRRYNMNMIDMSPAHALNTLSGGMMSGITNPSVPWIRLQTKDKDLNDSHNVRVWLDDVGQLILGVLGRSNFYNVMPAIYADLGLYSTASLQMDSDPVSIIRFYHTPMGTYRISNGARGTIDTTGRSLKLTALQMVEKFGKDNVSDKVKTAYDNANYNQVFEVRHLVQPRQHYNSQMSDQINMPWASTYWEKGNNSDKPLRVSGYRDNLFATPRWSQVGNDSWGSLGPGMMTLGQARGLQKDQRQRYEAQEKMINPPMVAPSSLRNSRATLVPGGITYVDSAQGQQGFTPAYTTQFRVDFALQSIAETQNQINQFMYADLFLLITNIDKSNVTATEIAQRQEEKLLMLGPVLNRLNEEALDPIVERVYGELSRRGMLPPAPEELDNQEIRIEYVSLMAQAQKLVGLTSLERTTSYIGNLSGLYPEAADKLNVDKAIDEYVDTVGGSPSIIRSEEEVAQLRQQRQAQTQAQQMGAMAAPMKDGAAAAKLLSETDMGGINALEQMQGNLQR